MLSAAAALIIQNRAVAVSLNPLATTHTAPRCTLYSGSGLRRSDDGCVTVSTTRYMSLSGASVNQQRLNGWQGATSNVPFGAAMTGTNHITRLKRIFSGSASYDWNGHTMAPPTDHGNGSRRSEEGAVQRVI